MVIGILKEVKLNEYRVSLTPDAVHTLVSLNHKVLVEQGAGEGADFSDQEYEEAGAVIVTDVADVFRDSDMVLHVRRPHPEDYHYIREDQIIMAYFHSVNNEEQTRSLLELKAVCIAYEMIKLPDSTHPLMSVVSEIAGKMAPIQGAKYLEKGFGGAGIFLGGIPGVEPAHVVVIGSGVVGTNAAKMAASMGANVTLMGLFSHELRRITPELPGNVNTLVATPWNIKRMLPTMDILIGAIRFEGNKSIKVVNRSDLQLMKKGTVLVDVTIDQGGCFETSHPTNHSEPVYTLDGIIHYCVPNMAGAYAKTASISLSNATLPYIAQIAAKGWKDAAKENPAIAEGLQFARGKLLKQSIAESFGLEYLPVSDLLSEETPI